MKNTLGQTAFRERFENTKGMGAIGCVDVGVGDGACQDTGLTLEQVAIAVGPLCRRLIDKGANMILLNGVTLYAHRRGHCVDVGNRSDFEELGWRDIVEFFDKKDVEEL